MSSQLISIKPIGGVGQIGSNMTLISYRNHRILIDAGILFPSEDFFDIDYLIPDLNTIDQIDTLIITHGHEDHIGAVFNVIKKFNDIKIYAPKFAAALIRKKLEFNKSPYPVNLFDDNSILKFSDLEVHAIHVNHSIPDTKGLFLSLPNKSLGFFFISDFKIDFKTKYESPFDFDKLIKLSSNLNKRFLLVDSTNITSSIHSTPSEMDVLDNLENIISKCTSRIFVTLFSSNIHRIHSLCFLAEKYQFKIVPHGRSMISYINSAIEEGLLPKFEGVIKSNDSVMKTDENVIVLLSGCQGDFLGSFRRFCMGEDSTFKPKATDTMIISSKAIPGNEKKINFLINKLSEIGVSIHTPAESLIHVSGHPGKNDLKMIYDRYAPTDIIPIHGETFFIREHIKFIKQTTNATPHFLLNHNELIINEDLSLKLNEVEKVDPVIYHGKHIVIEKEKISERRKLACNGTFFISLKIDSKQMKVTNRIYHYLGLPNFVTENESHLIQFLDGLLSQVDFKNLEVSTEEIRISIRRYFDNQLGYKPIVMVHLL